MKRISPHRLGLKIAIADCDEQNLAQVGHELTTIIGQSNVLVVPTDVSKLDQVVKLRDKVYETWGEVRNFFFFLLVVGKSSLPSGPTRRGISKYALFFTCLIRIFSSDPVQMAFHFAIPRSFIVYTTQPQNLP